MDRLDRQRRDAQPLAALMPPLPGANDPRAVALRAELDAITERIAAGLPTSGDAAEDGAAIRQALLQDDRAREVMCQAVEVEAG
jgi:hypothetical protein